MKNLHTLTDKELTELAFGLPDKNSQLVREEKRRDWIATTDKTYLKYPSVEKPLEKLLTTPFEG